MAFHLGKVSSYPVCKGDRVILQSAGGGGYGDPLERNPALVCADVADGYVSVERAAAVYGVILREDGSCDDARTRERRQQLRAARHYGVVEPSAAPAYTGIRGSHRIQRLAPVWGERVGIVEGDLLELVSPRGAPVRAWVRFDTALSADALPLDELGLALLGVSPGDRIQLRVPFTLNSANDLVVRQGRITPVGDRVVR
jgi:N-methylhydantoinase B